jgi:hypothetical protein
MGVPFFKIPRQTSIGDCFASRLLGPFGWSELKNPASQSLPERQCAKPKLDNDRDNEEQGTVTPTHASSGVVCLATLQCSNRRPHKPGAKQQQDRKHQTDPKPKHNDAIVLEHRGCSGHALNSLMSPEGDLDTR